MIHVLAETALSFYLRVVCAHAHVCLMVQRGLNYIFGTLCSDISIQCLSTIESELRFLLASAIITDNWDSAGESQKLKSNQGFNPNF